MINRRYISAVAAGQLFVAGALLSSPTFAEEGIKSFNYANPQILSGSFDAQNADYSGHGVELSISAEDDPIHIFLDYAKYKTDTFNNPTTGNPTLFELDFATFGIGYHQWLGESKNFAWFANGGLKRAKFESAETIPGIGNGSGNQTENGWSLQLGAVAKLWERVEFSIKAEQFGAGDIDDTRLVAAGAVRLFGNFDLTAHYESYSDIEIQGYRVGLRWSGF